jgi:hypothetical protein
MPKRTERRQKKKSMADSGYASDEETTSGNGENDAEAK